MKIRLKIASELLHIHNLFYSILNMKKYLLIVLILAITKTANSQEFIRSFLPEHFDLWGTAYKVDAFGDETNQVIYAYVCKGEYVSTEGIKEDVYVVTKIDLREKDLTIDIYKSDYELQTFFALDFSLIKDMATGEISSYRFQTPKWASLLAPITEDEYRANPVKLLLDGNGQEIKFKVPHITSYNSKQVGQYNFSIISWNDDIRKDWMK